MTGIPVTIHVDRPTFQQLEAIAATRATSVRSLIVWHLRASLDPTRPVRVNTTRTIRADDVDEWVRLAHEGVTNNAIAEQFGVSKSLVSRYLLERGIRRKRRATAAQLRQEAA